MTAARQFLAIDLGAESGRVMLEQLRDKKLLLQEVAKPWAVHERLVRAREPDHGDGAPVMGEGHDLVSQPADRRPLEDRLDDSVFVDRGASRHQQDAQACRELREHRAAGLLGLEVVNPGHAEKIAGEHDEVGTQRLHEPHQLALARRDPLDMKVPEVEQAHRGSGPELG